MTPKEKANELYDKMVYQIVFNTQPSTVSGVSKQCALIAVDEILKIADEQYYRWHFWEEVKQEIEKL